MESLALGDPVRVGDFVLRARLGAGGMGEVFLGRSPGGRAVAVKIVYPHLARQSEFRHRFRLEVAAAQAVSGAYTAPVVAAGADDDPPWIATSYVPGPSLAEAIAEAGPLPDGSVWPLAAGLAEALQAIHAQGLLHRDLKPSNVLLATDGPRVIDFGIARAMDAPALTRTGTIIGTPGFMSPEQAQGSQVGPASDVFSLGALLAFAATGSEPFGQGPPLVVLQRVLAGEPRLNQLTDPLRALVSACLARNPADRPALAQLLARLTFHWELPTVLPDTPPWPHAMTTLIQTLAPTVTAPFTEHGASAREDLMTRSDHAREVGEAGEHAEAARLFAELAADQARVLGPDHPDTLNARYDHAWYTGDTGADTEAARLFAELAADRARVWGPDHPDTLNTRRLHAHVLGRAGEHAEAARLLTDLVADAARALDPDHPYALITRLNHAHALGRAGERAEAARLSAELAADQARVLGPDHPHTLNARSLSDHWSP